MLDREENDQRLGSIWAEVKSKVANDARALDVFIQHWQAMSLIRCPRCSSDQISREPGERRGTCNDCGQKLWVTSGTVLERAALIRGYLAATLFFEAGLTISGPEFSRLTGIPQTSSYNILRKFRMAICNQMPEGALEFSGGLLQLVIAKRTQETPARCHPFSEQLLIDETIITQNHSVAPDAGANFDDAVENKDDLTDDDNLSEYEKVKKVVSRMLSDVGLTADTIALQTGFTIGRVTAGLSELELFGEARVEPGGKYFRCIEHNSAQVASPLSQETLSTINLFLNYIIQYFHRIGRKGLQTYVAALWCASDRERWGRALS